MSAALDAHFSLMALARETHSVRTVAGRAYPVPEGELAKWEAQQAEELKRRGLRYFARRAAQRAFRDG